MDENRKKPWTGTPMAPVHVHHQPHAMATVDRLPKPDGEADAGQIVIRTLMVTPQMLMLEAIIPKGNQGSHHRHDDHDTMCYLVRGHMDVTIDGKTYPVHAGDSWQHPKGVWHSSFAPEASVQLEVKTPAIKTWHATE